MSVKWFVCGAGNIDDYGLPSVVHVCPIEGADWSKPYFPESTHPKLRDSAERIKELEAALQLVSDQHYNDRRVGVFPTHIMKVVDGVLEVKDEYMD